MNNTLPLFIWSVVYGVPVELVEDGMKTIPHDMSKAKENANANDDGFDLDEDIDLSNEVEVLAVQLIELMRTLLAKKKLKSLVKMGLSSLVNCICYYMLFSKYQERIWFEDPNEFQAEEEDTKNMVSIRIEVSEILDSLIGNFPDEAIQAVMVNAEKFLSNMKDEEVLFEGDHPDHVWKKREVGLLLMGTFAEDIVSFLAEKNPSYNVLELIEKLVVDFNNDSITVLFLVF